MNTQFTVYALSGEIIRTGFCQRHMVVMQCKAGEVSIEKPSNIHINYVANGEICEYTDRELQSKQNILEGWTWKMPERIAVDLRSTEQRLSDDARLLQEARSLEYPPLSDFADAMYWQAQGDNTKMNAYMSSCAAVKAKYPKPV